MASQTNIKNQFRPTWAEIRLDFLAHNFQALKKISQKNTFFCPMVKANAYGHGAVESAKVLEKLDGLSAMGVALVEEGIELREAGIQKDILVFGISDQRGILAGLQFQLTPVVSTWETLYILEEQTQRFPIKIHLKWDTGMHRLGFNYLEASKISEYIKKSNIKVVGHCTHLHTAEDFLATESESQIQLQKFSELLKYFDTQNCRIHALNSAGLIGQSLQAQVNPFLNSLGARPGISLYGYPYKPSGFSHLGISLKPVMNFKTSILKILNLEAGESVSYNWRWKADRRSRIGVLAVGYADGYTRLLTNKSEVAVGTFLAPLRGTICMDYCMVDLTDVPMTDDECFKTEVTLWGDHLLSAEDLASQVGTISYEFLTSVSQRVPRIYKGHL